ncbi:hypothetical protein ACHAWF_009054 [Thalassiosira exigua]
MAFLAGMVSHAACVLAVALMGDVHAKASDAAARYKQYIRYVFPDDPSIVVVEPPHHIECDNHQGRVLETNGGQCDAKEGFWMLQMTTDYYPWETAWQVLDISGKVIDYGPPDGKNYERNTTYTATLCLPVGGYRLRMTDRGGDGICCDYGEGLFKGSVDGTIVVESDDSSYEQNDYVFAVYPPATPLMTLPLPEEFPVLDDTHPGTPVLQSPLTGEPLELEDSEEIPESESGVENPNQVPGSGDTREKIVAVSFILMGDVPYHSSERYCLNEQLRSLDPGTMDHPYKFIVHVGDIKKGYARCNVGAYSDVAQVFAHANNSIHYDARDVFFLIGDNEWNDCRNPEKSFSYWMNSFGNGPKNSGRNTGPNPYGFGTLSDPTVAQTLTYDNQGKDTNSTTYPSSASNFAFYFNRVLFLSIHQEDGKVGDEKRRVANNFQWVKSNMEKYEDQIKTVVIFAHAGMSLHEEYFGIPFKALLSEAYPDIFCLYAHGDWHTFSVGRVDRDIRNLIYLSCDMGRKTDPLLVSIVRDPSGGRDGLRINRRGGRYEDDCDGGDEELTWGSQFR